MSQDVRVRAAVGLTAFGLGALLLLHTTLFRDYLTDDAFISFRYLENALAGHGLVYNPGERVWGYTNFLWIAALLPGVAAGLAPEAVARGLGVACNVAVLLGVVLAAGRGHEEPLAARLAAGLLLASSGAFVLQGVGGLETSLFSLLVVAALLAYGWARASGRGGGFASAGAALALATLTRPEGFFLFGAMLGHAWLERRSAVGSVRGLLLGYLPFFLTFLGLAFVYYGALWPNSIDAKVGLSAEQLRRGIHYGVAFATHYPVWALVLLTALVARRQATPAERCALWLAAVLVALAVASGGDWMPGYRLFHPVIAVSAMLVPLCLRALRGVLPEERAGYAVAALVVIAAVVNALPSALDRRVQSATRPSYVHDGIEVGRWIREHLDPDALLATNTAGTVAYFSRLRIVDMMGINDPVIAGRRDVPPTWKGIEKGDGDYVLSRRPDYILFGSSTGSATPIFLSDSELFGSEEFWRHYRLARHRIGDDTQLLLYERLETPRSEPLSAEARREIDRVVVRAMERSRFRY